MKIEKLKIKILYNNNGDYMKIDRENILYGLEKEDKMLISNLLDKYLLYKNKGISSTSNFLNPREIELWKRKVSNTNIVYQIISVFPDSEKKLICFGDDSDKLTIYLGKTSARVRHKDILGSLFNLGLSYDTIGDIYVCSDYFYLVNLTRLNKFIENNLTKIGNSIVKLEIVPEIVLDHDLFKRREVIVGSMRLDIIVSKLGNFSRSISQDKITSGEVMVNYMISYKNILLLNEGDILSIRRVGKFKVGKIIASTKKDKYILEIFEYC